MISASFYSHNFFLWLPLISHIQHTFTIPAPSRKTTGRGGGYESHMWQNCLPCINFELCKLLFLHNFDNYCTYHRCRLNLKTWMTSVMWNKDYHFRSNHISIFLGEAIHDSPKVQEEEGGREGVPETSKWCSRSLGGLISWGGWEIHPKCNGSHNDYRGNCF